MSEFVFMLGCRRTGRKTKVDLDTPPELQTQRSEEANVACSQGRVLEMRKAQRGITPEIDTGSSQ